MIYKSTFIDIENSDKASGECASAAQVRRHWQSSKTHERAFISQSGGKQVRFCIFTQAESLIAAHLCTVISIACCEGHEHAETSWNKIDRPDGRRWLAALRRFRAEIKKCIVWRCSDHLV